MTTDAPQQLGMVGLGRMGANLVRRLIRDGHQCVVYDVNRGVVREWEADGATGADTLEDLVTKLRKPRAVWLMAQSANPTNSRHGCRRHRASSSTACSRRNS